MKRKALYRFGLSLAIATCAAVISAHAAIASGPDDDITDRVGIAATVNDDAITFTDVRNRLDLYLSGNPQKPPPAVRRKLELQVLDKLIDEKLELQEAKKDGITVTDDDIKSGFNEIAHQNHMPPDQFRDKLKAMGVKMSTLTDQIRAEIAWSLVVRRKLRPDINVSESDIDSAMAQMSKSKNSNEYLLAEILLPVPGPEMEDTVRHDADDIIASLHHGANFAVTAQHYSKAPGASQGGDLGWVQENTLDPKVAAVVKNMHPGEISPPIRTDKGFDIIFMRDIHRAGEEASVEAQAQKGAQPEAQAPAPAPAAPAAAPAKAETIVHLKQITIPIAATDPPPVVAAKMNRAVTLKSEISGCAEMDKRSKDFISPGTSDMGSGPMSALPEPVRRAIENLPIGELSAPVRGDNGVAVLMVCARETVPGKAEAAASPPPAAAPATAPAPAPAPGPGPAAAAGTNHGSADRDRIANEIGMKRLDQMQEHYLRDLRAAAFIDKRL